jgi:hypothetical protein
VADEDGIFTVDPDEAFEVIPEGEYTTYVTEVVKKRKEGAEYPYVELTMTVADGQYEGWTVMDRLTENPSARWRLARLVKAAGLAREGGEQQYKCSDLKGCVLVVQITHEEFKGMKMARPSRYSMHDSVQKRLDDESKGVESQPAAPAAPAASAPAAHATATAAAPATVVKKPPPKPPQTQNRVKV